ncbi:MAG TPA: DUF1254 domain-containing protein [Candidatus Saccharimonadales bacterium]|jgi:hypothetical protein|nr:DUF1254 domain-containing protein [Candidatus Saccharimonadales bacterium]
MIQPSRFPLFFAAALIFAAPWSTAQTVAPAAPPLTPEETHKIAVEAYTFAYPLVLVEMTRRATTLGGAPQALNRFRHEPAFPDDRFRQVVRPNADTLYSAAWFDLSKEPVLLHVPDTKGRYYLMQIMDAWSETIASPGKRTTGTGAAWFAVVGPGWKGKLPEHVQRIDCPTNTAWLIGRTQTNGPADYDFVHSIQQAYKLAPLSSYPEGLPPKTLYTLPARAIRRAGLSTAPAATLYILKNPGCLRYGPSGQSPCMTNAATSPLMGFAASPLAIMTR